MINFISNLPRGLRTGGFSALNSAAYDALHEIDTINYAGPIDPPIVFRQKLISKLSRSLGSQGDFFAFSRERLKSIAQEVDRRCVGDARLDCFHGFTPWTSTVPRRPYVTWGDCTFHDYISVYHRREKFRENDLDRIEHAEARWLHRSHFVAFTSRWAADRAVERYGLNESSVRVIGIFGQVEPPAGDEYKGRKQFAFVSTDFQAKGGPVAVAAMRQVRKRHPDASLVIVGAPPSDRVIDSSITYAGYLRKEIENEYRRFRNILSQSFALVHPTISDISPHIVVEAGYFGCPAISSRLFAIPELIDDRRTGLLLDEPSSVDAVAAAMCWMLENDVQYQHMRRAALAKARGQHSKAKFGGNLRDIIRAVTLAPLVSLAQ